MPIKFRKRRNLQRGTEIGFATIPVDEVRRLASEVREGFDERDRRISYSGESETEREERESKIRGEGYIFKNKNVNKIITDIAQAISHFYQTYEGDDLPQEVRDDRRKFQFRNKPNHYVFAMRLLEDISERIEQIEKSRDGYIFTLPKKGAIRYPCGGEDHAQDFRMSQSFLIKKVGNNFLIAPMRFSHSLGFLRRRNEDEPYLSSENFDDLKSILESGFHDPRTQENASFKTDNPFNQYHDRRHKKGIGSEEHIAQKDKYSIEFVNPDRGRVDTALGDDVESWRGFNSGSDTYWVEEASLKNISAINIDLDKDAPEEIKEKKMTFYTKEIQQKYHVPVRFYLSIGNPKEYDPKHPFHEHKRIYPRRKTLEQQVSATTGFIGLLSSLFFLSSTKFTGNVVGISGGQVFPD